MDFRREAVFLALAGVFLGSMAMLNILGVSRFVDFSFEVGGFRFPFIVAVGVLAYPVTFLCTDFISELYGRRRASLVVWVGLVVNVWVVVVVWVGGILPPVPAMDPATHLPDVRSYDFAFYRVRLLTLGAVAASMIAYLSAQFCDVYLFHFWKRLTNDRHLWLRNNGSTMVSQFIDTFAVITITHFVARGLPVDSGQPIWPQLWVFIGSGYVFKIIAAAVDTIPFYIGTAVLKRYLGMDPKRGTQYREEPAS